MGKQIQLLLLDEVFHLTPGTVELLVEGLSLDLLGSQRGDDESEILD